MLTTSSEQLKLEMLRRKEWIEAALLQSLLPGDAFPPEIHAAMVYGVMNGGKRLRPILLLEACRMGGGAVELALPVACALEMIHSYSLIHDDLPCMDDDDFRRGQPTCHKVYGEATAVLAGDALLGYAFQVVAAAPLSAELKVELVLQLAQASGSQGMIGGQILDLAAEEHEITLEQLQQIHDLKTGMLFRAALRCGGLIAGMQERELNALHDYARHFGMAFQITDDILDVEGEEAALGKPIGSDQRNWKNTYASFFSVERARALAAEYVSHCHRDLSIFAKEADFLRQLADYLLQRRS